MILIEHAGPRGLDEHPGNNGQKLPMPSRSSTRSWQAYLRTSCLLKDARLRCVHGTLDSLLPPVMHKTSNFSNRFASFTYTTLSTFVDCPKVGSRFEHTS